MRHLLSLLLIAISLAILAPAAQADEYLSEVNPEEYSAGPYPERPDREPRLRHPPTPRLNKAICFARNSQANVYGILGTISQRKSLQAEAISACRKFSMNPHSCKPLGCEMR